MLSIRATPNMHDIKVAPKLHQFFWKICLVFDLIAQSPANLAEVNLDIDAVAFRRIINVLFNVAFVYEFEHAILLRLRRAAIPDPIIL